MTHEELKNVFALNLYKYLDDQTTVERNIVLKTKYGDVPVDFFLKSQAKRVVIYIIDNTKSAIDEWYSAALFDENVADVAYTIRASDIYEYLEDCMYVVARLDSSLFSQRGLINLDRLKSEVMALVDYEDCRKKETISITYNSLGKDGFPKHIFLLRYGEDGHENSFWRTIIVPYIQKHIGESIEDIYKSFMSENRASEWNGTDPL